MSKVIKVLFHDDIKNQDITSLFKYKGAKDIGFSSRVYVSYGYKSRVKGYVIDVIEEEQDVPFIIELVDEFPLLDILSERINVEAKYYFVSLYKILSKVLPFPRKEVEYRQGYYVPISPTPRDKLNKREYDLLQKIKNEGRISIDELSKSSSLKTLLDKKYIKVDYFDEEEYSFKGLFNEDNDDYQIVDKILTSEKKNVLIETNNSYDEDMLISKLCAKVLANNQSVLIINPYLSKADPLIELLSLSFIDKVSLLSLRNSSEYIKNLKTIKNKKNFIVLGDKYASFAPISDLGLIIIKNSENSSYKDNDIYINYKSMAMRSEYKVYLFSSSPSIDIKARQIKGYLDGFDFKKKKNISYNLIKEEEDDELPLKVLDEIKKCLDNKEQVMIFNNKRGYASIYQCNDCKRVAFCPTCGTPFTYYKDENELRCLKCGFVSSLSSYQCETCGGHDFHYKNLGTIGIQDYLKNKFNDVRISRLDYDSIKDRDYQMDLSAFALGDNDILIGTKGIATHVLLPKVNLIIVMDIDWILNVSNYFIEEKYYDLLSSLLSSASFDAKAYIISNNVDNNSMKYLALQDYNFFYEKTMEKRKLLLAPPYYYLIEVSLVSENYELLEDTSNKVFDYFENKFKDKRVILLGPNFKKFNVKEHRYIASIMIKYKNRVDIDEVFNEFASMNMPKGVNININVDPEGE